MSTPPPPATVQAGRARTCITPPVGASLAGYFHDRVSQSVRDELYANAVVLTHGDTRLALVSCDLICIDEAIADAAKADIARATNIVPDHVLICATHTHTGPEVRDNAVVPVHRQWRARLSARITEAVCAAAADLVPVTLRAGSTPVEGYSFNRLFRMKDGTELFGRRAGREVREAGPIDPELQTLSLVDADENLRALIINFALHPDVIGGGKADFISADWPGEIAGNVRTLYGEDAVTVFLQGTAGDINHNIHRPTALPTRGPKKAVQLGRALAGAAMLAAERAEPMNDVRLAAAMRVLQVPYYTRDDTFRAQLEALKKKPNPTSFEKHIIARGEAWPHDRQNAEVPVQVMRIGEVALAAFPAEIFVRIGLEVKHFSPAEQTFVVELANARSSTYVPTTDQAERGAYGAKPILSRWLCADAGRRMADAAQVMLWKLWE